MQTPLVVESCHQCLKWLIPQLDKFPRSRRFTLGEKLESHLMDTLALLTQAAYGGRQRISLLQQANQKLAVVRHLWRLSFELKVIDKRRYQYGSEMIVNIGKQVGGWLRSGSQH